MVTYNKILLLTGFSVLAPFFLINAYANLEDYTPEITLVSSVPIEQVDSSYKNLPLDHTKDAVIVYLDGNDLSVRHTSEASLIEYTSSANVAIEGTCLNTYDVSSGMQTNDMCQQGIYFPLQYWTETQIGKFIILQ